MSHGAGSWRVVLALAAILAIAYGSTVATHQVTNDVTSTTITSWRLAETGTPWLDGVDYQQYENPAPLWVDTAPNGHVVAFRSPGPIAAGVPAYFAARLVGVDEYSTAPGSITAAVLTGLAMVLLYLGLQPRVGTRLALGGVLTVALTTPVWSVSADALWTHPVTLLGISGMVWGCARERWWLVGLFGAVAVWGRLHTAVIVAIVGLMVGWSRRDPRVPLVIGAVSVSGLGLSVFWSRWMYGTWSPAGGYSVSSYAQGAVDRTDNPAQLLNHLGLWVAPDRGLLVWTPVILVLVPALVRAWRHIPAWARAMLVGGLAYAAVQAQLNGFSGGGSFYGYRLTLETLVSCAPALIFAISSARGVERLLLGGAVALQLTAFSLGASGEGGVLSESESWTNNSFVHLAVTEPLVGVVAAVTVMIGMYAGHLFASDESPRSPGSLPRPDGQPARSRRTGRTTGR